MRTPLLFAGLAALASCARATHSPFELPHKTGPADPHLIEMSSETTSELVPAGTASGLAIRIRVSAARVPSANRPPLDLVLLLDTSGSMEGASIDALRRAAHDLVERMGPRDHLSVVTFDSTANVLVPSVVLDGDARADALDKIDHLKARGTTDMADGLALALQQVSAGRVPDSIDRIVLLGDGVPNDPAPLPGLIEQARGARVSITTLGLGIDFDENLLQHVAMETGGVYRFVDRPAQVADVFDHELVRMQTVVGRNLYLQIQPGPGVTIDDMPGLTPSGAARYAMLGDLASGETRDVIVPVHVTGHRDGATVELVDAVLTFDDSAAQSGTQRRDTFASAKASADAEAVKGAIKVDVAAARARADAAGAILQAIAMARAGQIDQARGVLEAAETAARAFEAKVEDGELKELIDEIVQVKSHLRDLVVQQIPDRQAGAGGAAESDKMPAAAAPAVAPADTEVILRDAHAHASKVLDQR